MKYDIPISPVQWAESFIMFFAHAAGRALRISPPARVSVSTGKAVLKFTGVGRKYRHHVYIEFHVEDNRGIFTVKPPYPMYLFALVAPFLTIPSYPMYAAREDDNIKVILTQSYEEAINYLADAMRRIPLLDPTDFLEDTSFEGYLYELPVGYVAFIEEKPGFGDYFDVIETHEEDEEEDEDIMHPSDFFTRVIEEVVKSV